MKKTNKIITYLLSALMLSNCISPIFAYAAEADASAEEEPAGEAQLLSTEEASEETDYNFTDVSHVTDEEFFGEWDDKNEAWKTEGKLNYDYSPDLAEVERLVKLNSYSLAKDALYDYYKNRTSIPDAEYRGGIDWSSNVLWMRDAYQYSEPLIAQVNITNATEEYQEYEVELSSVVSDGVFVLSSINKTSDMIEIASRETQLSPELIIERKDGQRVSLYPSKDTYIRGYDENADYRDRIYGSSEKLFVKDSYTDCGDGRYQPFSSLSRRTYIAFDRDDIPNDAKKMFLKIHARIVPEEGAEQATDQSLELMIFNAYNKSWDEVEAEDNEFLPMTWGNYKFAHYSWNGIPGGFDNKNVPANLRGDWYNQNTQFNNTVSLARSALQTGNDEYMIKAISTVLDFISDTNGIITTVNTPKNRDLESMHRVRNATALLCTFLQTDIFNAEALTAMLKWMREEMTYLYNGAGCLFEGATDIPTSNNYAHTNRGFWHSDSMESVCIYYPEFAETEMWKELADKRLRSVVDVLINDDGCFEEATFAYPGYVFSDYILLWKKLEHSGEEIPDWYAEKFKPYANYMMNISFPNHIPPNWGEGVPSSSVGRLNNFLTIFDDENIEYVVTDGAEGEVPGYTAAYFDRLKIATCRTGWTRDASMLMINAKNGGNHNHKDSLHLMFHFGGFNLLDDTGMTSYDKTHPHFQWQRHATRSHNTIEIDGTPQRGSDLLYNDSSDPTLWNGFSRLDLYPGTAADRIEAWTDATEGFRHYRNVSYVKAQDFIIVSDMVQPSDGEEHSYTQNWHTYAKENSRPTIDNITKTGKTNYHGMPNLIIAQANTDNVSLTLETGYSVDSPSPTKYFCYTQEASGPVMYNTVLYPVAEGDAADISIENVDTGVDSAVASAMNVNIFKNDDDVVNVFYYNSFEETPAERTFGSYITDAGNVTVQQDLDGAAEFYSMYNGSKFLRNGEAVVSSDTVLEDIEVVFDGKRAIITSSDESIASAKLVLMSPKDITDVTVNGNSVDFVFSDGKIYINNPESVDFTSDSGYYVRLTAVNGGNSYPVTVEIPQNCVTYGALSMPQCVNSGGVFNLSFGSATLASCAKITAGGHTDKNVVAVLDGSDRSITATIGTGSEREAADGYVTSGAPVLERAREDLVIWTKDATVFKIGASSEGYGDITGEETGGGESSSPGYIDFPAASGNSAAEPSIPTDTDGAAAQAKDFTFDDCSGHWAEEYIRDMYSKGYINGVSETAFAPDAIITRAEFAAIAVRILGLEQGQYSDAFADVLQEDWFASVVEAAYRAGIIQGADGLFRPRDNITRQEMAVIIMRIYEMYRSYEPKNGLSFADSEQIADWARTSVASACGLGLVNGVGDGRFAPFDNATRAQAVTVFARLIDITQAEED